MVFKINLSTKKGKTYKLETEAPSLMQKQIGDKIKGEDISQDFAGYELEITGASDLAGFTSMKEVQGIALKKLLLEYGKAMHKRSKGLRKKPRKPTKGLRLRKTVRGNTISEAISQINIKVIKEGNKKLSEMFPEQNKEPEAPNKSTSESGSELNKEASPPSQEQAEALTEEKQEKKAESEIAHPTEEPKQELPADTEKE